MAVNILYVNGGLMNRGGVETFMMNYIRHMDTNKVHIDVAVKGLDKAAYDEELEALGCKLYRLPEKVSTLLHIRRSLAKQFAVANMRSFILTRTQWDAGS